MANTSPIKQVHDYVRRELEARYHIPFEQRELKLSTGAAHTFNAVSSDGRIVASIKTSSGLTSGGKRPAAKVQAAVADLYYLSLVDAETKLLVLTTAQFRELFEKEMRGKLAAGIVIEPWLQLPPELQARVSQVQREASDEMSG